MSDASSPDDLMQQVRTYLKKVYQGAPAGGGTASQPAGSSQTVLAFEPIGMPVSPADFRLNENDSASPMMPMIGLQRTSLYSNWIRRVDDYGTLDLGLQGTVDGQYNIILNESMPAPDNSVDGFSAVKAPAKRAFDGALITGLDTSGVGGDVHYYPVHPTPPDWYDPSNQGNWNSCQFGSGSSPTLSGQGGGTSTPTPSQPSLRLRVLPPEFSSVLTARPFLNPANQFHAAGPALSTPAASSPAPMSTVAPIARATMLVRPLAFSSLRMSEVATTPSTSATAPSAVQSLTIRPIAGFRDLVDLSQQATAQSTQSDSLSATFEYCLVQLDRPWLSYDFLSSAGWYIPGRQSGELSNGDDLTGRGRFSLVPIAFIAINKLKITANWSQADKDAVQNAVAIGQFSLVGREFDGAALTCDGIQIIAWACAAMPVLPPAPDPTLPPPTTASQEQTLQEQWAKLKGNASH